MMSSVNNDRESDDASAEPGADVRKVVRGKKLHIDD